MIVERTAGEFVIRFPFASNTERMQDLIDYLRYKELTLNANDELKTLFLPYFSNKTTLVAECVPSNPTLLPYSYHVS